jgi:hypothetical protein
MADAVAKALEAVHASLNNNNEDLDARIAALKQSLADAGQKSIVVDRTRLPQNNRQGRKMMQTYFRKRGVEVEFGE